MKSRHRAREIALQILYQYDLMLQQTGQAVPTGQGLIQDLTRHYDHFKVAEDLREFVGQLVVGTLHNLQTLDPLLEKHAVNWKIGRMSSVDRSLLRLASYEMIYMANETPRSIVIDEAIEIAKQFGTAETPSFINGVLDSIKIEEKLEA